MGGAGHRAQGGAFPDWCGLCVGQAHSGIVGASTGLFGHGATCAAHALRGCTNEQL